MRRARRVRRRRRVRADAVVVGDDEPRRAARRPAVPRPLPDALLRLRAGDRVRRPAGAEGAAGAGVADRRAGALDDGPAASATTSSARCCSASAGRSPTSARGRSPRSSGRAWPGAWPRGRARARRLAVPARAAADGCRRSDARMGAVHLSVADLERSRVVLRVRARAARDARGDGATVDARRRPAGADRGAGRGARGRLRRAVPLRAARARAGRPRALARARGALAGAADRAVGSLRQRGDLPARPRRARDRGLLGPAARALGRPGRRSA